MTLRFRGKKALEQSVSWGFINETEYFYVIPTHFPNNKEIHILSSVIVLKIMWTELAYNESALEKMWFSVYMKMWNRDIWVISRNENKYDALV